jgi:hypothetical protein
MNGKSEKKAVIACFGIFYPGLVLMDSWSLQRIRI